MKHFLFIVAILFAIAGTAMAQSWTGGVIVIDSTRLVNRDTNITNICLLNRGKSSNWTYSVQIVSDSISGANDGTAYLQVSNDGYTWYNVQTLTLNGTAQQQVLYEGILYAMRMRVYAITPNATARNIAFRVKATLRKSK